MWQTLKRKKLRAVPLTVEWRRIIEAGCPFYHQLPAADRKELEGHVQVFMAEKRFESCGGMVLTDEIRVCIAAHACLLLLHRETDYFPRLKSVLVYPNMYAAPSIRHVGSGIMEEYQQQRAGESWQHGAVVLAWDVMRAHIQAPEAGHNLVLHEFAHQLDYEDGGADGVPLLGHGEPLLIRRSRYASWTQVMRAEFELLQAKVKHGEPTVMRDYGATNGAEFFAVATECFFGKPMALRQENPKLYEEMQWYYRQDPAGWMKKGNI